MRETLCFLDKPVELAGRTSLPAGCQVVRPHSPVPIPKCNSFRAAPFLSVLYFEILYKILFENKTKNCFISTKHLKIKDAQSGNVRARKNANLD